jgi:hypothetical protein
MTNFGKGVAAYLSSPPSSEANQPGLPTSSGLQSSGSSTGDFLGGNTSTASYLGGGARGGLAKDGGHVAAKNPNQKAKKPGNSYDNDKIPAMLSEGEVVVPRSVMQSQDPVRGAADFVQKVLSKRKAVRTKQ